MPEVNASRAGSLHTETQALELAWTQQPMRNNLDKGPGPPSMGRPLPDKLNKIGWAMLMHVLAWQVT